jgi:CheY-like chemotaxis protein
MNPEPPLILLVEDNETIRAAFGILLTESGYRVLDAGTGADALRLALEELPDLVLMDLGLPDIGGLEVTRQLKANPQTRPAPVIALTGRALEADQEASMAAGCAAYLSKPVDTRALLATIAEFVGG